MTNIVTATYANDAYDPLRNLLSAIQRDDDLQDGPEAEWARQLLRSIERMIDGAFAYQPPVRLDRVMLQSARAMTPDEEV